LAALRASKVPQTVHAGLGCGIAKAPILGALQKVPDVADGTEVGVTLSKHTQLSLSLYLFFLLARGVCMIRIQGQRMKVLFLGDIVGKPGRGAVIARLAQLRAAHGADIVVANGENAASGAGINTRIARELREAGVDAITLGDHCWDQRGFPQEMDAIEYICRPANLPARCPGRTHLIVEKDGFRLGVVTLLGRQFMKIDADDPFACIDTILGSWAKGVDALLVEIHAEATSEKVALGWYLDGRAAAVIGTHTHIPTADARVLPRGTAYQTDAGMCGPWQSVLGRDIGASIGRFLDGMPRKLEVAEGDVRLCGLAIDIDPKTGRARAVERIELAV